MTVLLAFLASKSRLYFYRNFSGLESARCDVIISSFRRNINDSGDYVDELLRYIYTPLEIPNVEATDSSRLYLVLAVDLTTNVIRANDTLRILKYAFRKLLIKNTLETSLIDFILLVDTAVDNTGECELIDEVALYQRIIEMESVTEKEYEKELKKKAKHAKLDKLQQAHKIKQKQRALA